MRKKKTKYLYDDDVVIVCRWLYAMIWIIVEGKSGEQVIEHANMSRAKIAGRKKRKKPKRKKFQSTTVLPTLEQIKAAETK